MAQLGIYNTLPIIDFIEHGAILNGDNLGEILLPNRYVPQDAKLEDIVNVFLHADSQDRLIATTQQPKAVLGEFASLKVIQVNKIGAFLDWGLPKDLLVPFNQQHTTMELNKYYLVRVYADEATGRLAASSKIDKFLDVWPAEYKIEEEVSLIIGHRTDLGFKAIINNQHWGLIFQSDIFKPIKTGLKIKGYIKEVREDGRVTLTLSRSGKNKVIDFSDSFIAYLNKNNGLCQFHDKSSPTEIQREFGVSKKAFKATVGHLLKQGKIELIDKRIKLK